MSVKTADYEEQLSREIKNIPKEYLPGLFQIVRIFRESISLKPAQASFRQGWKEALAGEAKSVSDLWQGIGTE